MGRAPCCDKNGLKKGPWTPEEDQKLISYIQKHGYGNWRTLPKNAGLQRCGKSCRLRWTNYLRPDIKRGRFSFEEEETIIQLHGILGNKWSAIASRLPGRTDNEIKNYWNTHIRKRLLRMGIDPVTHSPRLDLLDLSSIFNTNASHLRISRLLGLQPLVNPEILKLATSIQNQQTHFNNAQHHLAQTTPTPTTSPCIPFSSSCDQAQVLNDFNQLYPSSNMLDFGFDAQNAWQRFGDTANSTIVEGHLPSLLDTDVVNQDNYVTSYNGFQDSDNNQNFSFSSVLSTPSSSPVTWNSNSNSNSMYMMTAEDERELLQQLIEV